VGKGQMTVNPYRLQPEIAFWSRSVARAFDAQNVVRCDEPLLQLGEKFASAGSCFAANVIQPLEKAGFEYVRTEELSAPLSLLPENLGYAKFSARYGNIYTARQFRQLIERAAGQFVPMESFWEGPSGIIDPYRPGLRYPARTKVEFDDLQEAHLAAVKRAFSEANVTIFTLGLTECWESVSDGAVFPTCPGTVAGEFNPDRHRFRNLTVEDVVSDMERAFLIIRTWNNSARFILTVSPVPLVATATNEHVLSATILSKSILRVAAGILAEGEGVTYFPAYEIVSGPQAPSSFYESDRREVSDQAVAAVMKAFISNCRVRNKVELDATGRIRRGSDVPHSLSRDLIMAECDEAVLDW
jgi:hypothetical protein